MPSEFEPNTQLSTRAYRCKRSGISANLPSGSKTEIEPEACLAVTVLTRQTHEDSKRDVIKEAKGRTVSRVARDAVEVDYRHADAGREDDLRDGPVQVKREWKCSDEVDDREGEVLRATLGGIHIVGLTRSGLRLEVLSDAQVEVAVGKPHRVDADVKEDLPLKCTSG